MFLGNAFQVDYPPYLYTGENLLIELCDSRCSRTGIIESSYVDEKDYTQGSKCELLAISMLSAAQSSLTTSKIPEMNVFSELKSEDPAVFYNVLWVEWENGIAYRKALGRVFKDAWEKQDLEEIEIALG